MARDLSYIHREIVRVAQEIELDPRLMTRSKFLKYPGVYDDEGNEIFPPTDVTKHDLHYYGGFTKLRSDAAHVLGIVPEKDLVSARGVELRNNHYRKVERKVATADYFKMKLEQVFYNVFSENPVPFVSDPKLPKKSASDKSVLNLLLSDLHFGISVDNEETLGACFNWSVAAERMGKFIAVAREWDSESERVRVFLNGDIIAGVVHLDDMLIRPLTEQIYGATNILIQTLDILAANFKSVEVVCVPGNHGRVTHKGPGRALAQRWDSHTHSIYLALQCRFKDHKRVTFDVPVSAIGVTDDLNGGCIVTSHGDTAPEVGNVSKKIDTDKIRTNLSKLDRVLPTPISIGLFGHWHTPTIQMLSTGQWIIVNGCLVGSDAFAQNAICEFDAVPAQIMFKSTKSEPLYDSKIVQLRNVEEKYKNIITPPTIRAGGKLVA